ncbi:MAG: glycosyltransferase [Erysipelotrichaceae bacterium]|nr:glycosyltransferase [Erysipelotrichaceae bacterium]MBQ1624599.1 glycosyltransferase [Erysipelotrichaceae bacterium]MBQ1812274.1 glycosyltransferase [Erysipelotrichaceae bacterium]MBQ1909908.1 glycosyltransferase [Erysipelotrichaceae bacterium]MBQ2078363.1 glycosyltransferase [Erysipelotrichaceae bacterium]
MKIGEFSDSFLPIIDGVGRVVYNYCDTIARKGHECTAIVPMDNFGYRGGLPFEIIDYYSRSIPLMSKYDAGLPKIDLHYNNRLKMTDFDIVHVHTPFIAGSEGVHYARDHKIPLVGTFHSKYYDDFLQLTGSRHIAGLGTDIIVKFYEQCDEVWAVSESSAKTLKEYGYSGKVEVMPNGMMIRELNLEWMDSAKAHFGIDDDPCLLFVGQMNWKKNILKILEACSILKKEGIAFNLIMAGKGPHEDEIKDKVKKLGIEEDTYIVGHVLREDLLNGLYMLADLFVFPSIYDNGPMVVREAANAGTPSIVVRGSSAAEGIDDMVNGFYCEDDSASIAQVIKKAFADREKTAMIGLEAKETIPVAWDDLIDTVIDRYQYLIDKRKGLQ